MRGGLQEVLIQFLVSFDILCVFLSHVVSDWIIVANVGVNGFTWKEYDLVIVVTNEVD
jgi:hypothetical protein